MSSSRNFPGLFRINDRSITDSIRVYLTDYEISLGDSHKSMFARERLILHPVSTKMFSHEGNVEIMRNGFFYSISGTKVGALTYGPLVILAMANTITGQSIDSRSQQNLRRVNYLLGLKATHWLVAAVFPKILRL